MRTIRENSFTQKVLDYLKDTSKDLLILGFKIAFDPHSLMKGMGIYTRAPRPYFARGLSNLKKSQYFFFKNGKFHLTSKGRIIIIKNIIRGSKRNKKTKWDGKWRGIIFDIPELNRKDRNFLRKELKWMGFKEVQKSIWLFPYDIERELKILIKSWRQDFKGDIRFVLIETIEDIDLKRHFQLY